MTDTHFTEEENNVWLAGLPKKSIATKVIVSSDFGNILLVKPTYKPGWQLPGGGVEPNEDPREAAIRELDEELGIKVAAKDLKLIDSVFRRKHDNLLLIYELTQSFPEDTEFSLQAEELEASKFEKPSNVGSQLSSYYLDFWNTYTKS